MNATVSDADSGLSAITANVSSLNSSAGTNGEVTLTTNAGGYYNYTFRINSTKPDGSNYPIQLNVTDNVTYKNTTTTTATVDSTPPTLTQVSPNNAWVNNGSALELEAKINDALSGVSSATVDISSVNQSSTSATLTYNATSDNWENKTYQIDTTNLGQQNLTVIANDNASNTNTSLNLTVQVDNVDPNAVANLSVTNTSGMNKLNWDAASDNGAIDCYKIYRNTSAGNFSDVNTSDLGSAGTNGGDLITTTTNTYYNDTAQALEPGTTYYYNVTAVDKADNEGSLMATDNSTTFEAGIPAQLVVSGPNSLTADGTSTGPINATVTDQYGRAVSGVKVAFRTDYGYLQTPSDTTNVNGKATVTLKAADDPGVATITATNSSNSLSNTTTVDFVNDTATVSMSPGWNLISLPLIPANDSIDSVLSGISGDVETVYYYDGTSWKKYEPGSSTNTLSKMEDGKAYWVEIKSGAGTVDLTVKGFSASDPGAGPVTYSLNKGWNMLGHLGTTATSAHDYLESGDLKSPDDFGTVSGYSGGYSDVNISSNGDDLGAGEGYWVYAKKSGTVAPSP